MNKSQKAIIDALKRYNSLTSLELMLITKQSPDGIRGRISEARNKFGYDIRFQVPKIPEKKYCLISSPQELQELQKPEKSKEPEELEELEKLEVQPQSENVNKLLTWLEEKNLFGRVIPYETISREVGISVEEVEDAVAAVFKTHIVVQMSNTMVKIKNR